MKNIGGLDAASGGCPSSAFSAPNLSVDGDKITYWHNTKAFSEVTECIFELKSGKLGDYAS